MFTINLIKEQEVSSERINKTLSYLIAAILPVMAIAAITLLFVGNTAVFASQKRKIAKYDASLVELSDAVKMVKEFDAEKKSIKKSLSELSGSLKKHTQWSPILIEVIDIMPDKMVMTSLKVRKTIVSRKVGNTGKAAKVNENVLTMSLIGDSKQNYDDDVREYADRIKSSQALKGFGFEQISISQSASKPNEQTAISYGIRCVFIN